MRSDLLTQFRYAYLVTKTNCIGNYEYIDHWWYRLNRLSIGAIPCHATQARHYH